MKPAQHSATALLAGVSLLTGVLTGCADANKGELQAWMDETRRATPPMRADLPAPRPFQAYRYAADDGMDPFAVMRVDRALALANLRPGGGLQPDLKRRRELLEEYPLDMISLVGHVRDGKQAVALVRVNGAIHQVRSGMYIGQNFGVITKVDETEVKVKEMVQDAAGEWVERETSLQLQEARK